MSADPAIFALLQAASGVTDIVGTKTYAVLAPQGTAAPYVTWTTLDVEDEHTAGADRDMFGQFVQVTCWADSFTAANALAAAVHTALSRKSGTFGSVPVQSIFRTGMRDQYGAAANLFGRSLDYRIWYGTE